MKTLAAFCSGLLFSAGLLISGMTTPANIVGFLDVFGDWKPALMLVMIGAVGAYALLYRVVIKRPAPLFSKDFDLPENRKADAKLVVGAAAFGIGWGLSGMCPGPAWVTLGLAARESLVFFIAMALGVLLFNFSSHTKDATTTDHDACG